LCLIVTFRQSADLDLFLGRRLNRSAIVDEKLTDSLTVLVNVDAETLAVTLAGIRAERMITLLVIPHNLVRDSPLIEGPPSRGGALRITGF
jgi:hypothetical protein